MSATEPAVRFTDVSDRLRQLAMAGVVAVHCTLPFGFGTSDHAVNQVGKFANGMFFMISAYLWQLRDGSSHPGTYLLNRLRSLALPYAVWAGITTVLVTGWFYGSANQDFSVSNVLEFVFVHTAMWFIPQMLLTLYLVSVIVRKIGRAYSGSLFLAITVFYGVNHHADWIEIGHTEAPLGFALFCWAGYVLFEREDQLKRQLTRVPASVYIAALIVTFVAAWAEGVYLQDDDSLRITSVLYTIVACAALLSIAISRPLRGRESPRGVSYGIYLIHTVVMLTIVLAFAFFIDNEWQSQVSIPWWINIPLRLLLIAFVWEVSRRIALLLHRCGFGRLAGGPAGSRGTQLQSAIPSP